VERLLDSRGHLALERLGLAERAGPLAAALEPRGAVELRGRHAREAVLRRLARDAHERVELVERALELGRGGLVVDLVVDAPALDLADVLPRAVELRRDVVLLQARLPDLALLLGRELVEAAEVGDQPARPAPRRLLPQLLVLEEDLDLLDRVLQLLLERADAHDRHLVDLRQPHVAAAHVLEILRAEAELDVVAGLEAHLADVEHVLALDQRLAVLAGVLLAVELDPRPVLRLALLL